MIDRLYKLMWLVLYILASIYETFCYLKLRLQAFILWSYDLWHSSAAITRRDRAFLQSCKAELTKLPQHLNLIIGPDPLVSVSEAVVGRILLYAQIIGIECVSLYDVRENMGHIVLERVFMSQDAFWRELQPNQYEWGLRECPSKAPIKYESDSNGCARNGTTSENGNVCNGDAYHNKIQTPLKIYQVTEQDNRPLIVKICRKLFQERKTSNVQNILGDRKKLEQYISDEVAQHMQWKFVDPELSIIFNRDTCTFGMLPWQTRFTEFHTFETGRCVNAESFAKVLYKYSKCEQRWGK
ncbi:dehydrodolichyl diphosphate synthase complex subunit nus1 [Anastrepha obliqua]|uniref:dehydrodolichyl diphosphate synthase complex subunit nus1 n=1 Tax=Anastrepha obliqua TaxID=95512 RepID=UPI0024099013|nr:dehydrodolichyl diphosphate synthase complex subunit nus1 [Anastrepha obliqua]